MSDSWYKDGQRANDDEMKREVITRILTVWQENPALRLMQLLGNVFRSDPYYIEDYDAVKALEEFYKAISSGEGSGSS